MTYNEFIQDIIDTRGQWADVGEHREIHHIIPKCKGGEPKGKHYALVHENLIWLTPREHFIAHKLLAEENSDDIKLVSAYMYMANSYPYKHNDTITPEEYEEARILYSNSKRGSKQTVEANNKRRETMKAHNLKWYNNGKNEIRSETCPDGWVRGRLPITEETRAKMKLRPKQFGEKNGMYGKKHKSESIAKLSEWSSARQWYNDGTNEYFEIDCPEGCVKGRLNSRRKWYNNGVNETFAMTCPEGWSKGRIKWKKVV